MDPLTFSYRRRDERCLPAPMVPITLYKPLTSEVACHEWAIVDTGADCTGIPPHIWERLGIPDDQVVEIDGVTSEGGVPAIGYPGPLTARVAGYQFHVDAVLVPGFPALVLGREDFMRAFHCHFDQRDQSISLEPHADVLYVGHDPAIDPTPDFVTFTEQYLPGADPRKAYALARHLREQTGEATSAVEMLEHAADHPEWALF